MAWNSIHFIHRKFATRPPMTRSLKRESASNLPYGACGALPGTAHPPLQARDKPRVGSRESHNDPSRPERGRNRGTAPGTGAAPRAHPPDGAAGASLRSQYAARAGHRVRKRRWKRYDNRPHSRRIPSTRYRPRSGSYLALPSPNDRNHGGVRERATGAKSKTVPA